MSIKKIFVDSFWYGVIPKLSTLINLLLLPIVTPYLSNYDYGVWGVITGYSGITVSICSLGLHVHLTNSYFEYKNKYNIVWSRLLYFMLLAAIFFSLLLFIILYFSLSELGHVARVSIAFLATFPTLFSVNGLLAQHLYPLRGNPKPLVIRNLVCSLLSIFVAFYFIYNLRLGFIGFVCGAAISSLASFVLFIPPIWIKEKIFPVRDYSKGRVKQLFNVALPAVPHALGFMLLSSSSRIIMNWYGVSLSDIGIYTNGYVIGDYINIVSSSVVTAFAPQIQRSYRDGQYNLFRKLYYFSQGIALFSIIMFAIWMPEIYSLLIRNAELHQSISIAQYSCFANAVFPLYLFMSAITFIEKRTKQLLWLVFVPGLLNVSLCLVLMPIYGYRVAIYTTLFSYWSQLFIPFLIKYYNSKTILWLGKLRKLVYLFVILLISTFAAIYIAHAIIEFKLLISVIITVMVLFFLKYFSKYNI